MAVYVRRAVKVEAFAFGLEPQPQWFIDRTNAGLAIDGMASFRVKKNARSLKLMHGDYVIMHNDLLWVCESEEFPGLYVLWRGEEEPVPTQVELQSVSLVLMGGFFLCIGVGYLLGAGAGWIATGIYAVVLGIYLWRNTHREQVAIGGEALEEQDP